MADFFPNGVITTLQEVGARDRGRREGDQVEDTRERPPALALRCPCAELQGAALRRIVDGLWGSAPAGGGW